MGMDELRLSVIPPRLEALLKRMHAHHKAWVPNIGWSRCSAVFGSGGSYSGDWEDFETSVDGAAVTAISTAWDSLNEAERLSVEVVMGWMPDVATVRAGVLEGAVEKLLAKCRKEGVQV